MIRFRAREISKSASLNQIRQYAAPIADDGSFTIPLVPEGRYRVQVLLNPTAAAGRGATTPAATPQLPSGAYLADICQANNSVYDNGLIVGADRDNPIDVFVATSAGSVEGRVLTTGQGSPSGATVVLVPPENRRQNSALYKVVSNSADGRYAINNVPPGNYTVYAWESVPLGAYQNAEFLSRYAGRGKAVTIQAGARTTVDVEVIPKQMER